MLALLAAFALAVPPGQGVDAIRPPIVQRPIPFGAARRREHQLDVLAGCALKQRHSRLRQQRRQREELVRLGGKRGYALVHELVETRWQRQLDVADEPAALFECTTKLEREKGIAAGSLVQAL